MIRRIWAWLKARRRRPDPWISALALDDGVEAGDLLVMWLPPGSDPPDGWARVGSDADRAPEADRVLFYRIADGGESLDPGTVAYRGVDPVNPFVPINQQGTTP